MNFSKFVISIPTYITLVRLVLIPFVVMAILSAHWYSVLFLFLGAILTDFLDGFLARYWNDQTVLGEVLDPIADKLLLLSCFCALAYERHGFFGIPVWFVIFICIKELILLIGFLCIRYCFDTQNRMSATFFGKLTGSVLWILVIFIVLSKLFLFRFYVFYNVLLIACVISSLVALAHYCYVSYKALVK